MEIDIRIKIKLTSLCLQYFLYIQDCVEQKMHSNSNTYLTEIQLTNKSEDKKPHFNDSHLHLTPPFQRPHKNQFSTSIKHAENHQLSTPKIFTKFLHDNYYQNKKVKPGFHVLKTIVEGEQRRKDKQKIPKLCINIPYTVLFTDNSYQLIYTKEGTVHVQNDFSFNLWQDILKDQKDNQNFPAAIQIIGTGIQFERSIIMGGDLTQKIMPKNQTQGTVKYTTPYGSFPNVLRLFYYPSGTKTTKKSFGYKLVNKKKLNEDLMQKKHKLVHYFIVDTDRQGSFEAVLVKGKALKELESMSQSLVCYLQHLKGARISQIVLDFTFDENRVYWLSQVLSIKSINESKIWVVGSQEQILNFNKEQNNHIHCKLCSFVFPKRQVCNRVTNKLIAQLITHMKKRGKFFPIDVSLNRNSLSDSINVCSICFELILAEHQLVDVEQQFCQFINISSNPIERVPLEGFFSDLQKPKINSGNNKKQQIFNILENINTNIVKLTKPCLLQWRLFFFLERIKHVPRSNAQNYTITMKFKDKIQTYQRQVQAEWKSSMMESYRAKSAKNQKKFVKQSFFSPKNESRAETKKSTFPTHYTNRTNEANFIPYDKMSLILNKIKVLVFYTKQQQVKNILMDEELYFEFTIGSQVYKGSSATLQIFGNKKECQRHSCEILLFDEEYNYCNLELSVGLTCDGLQNIENMDIYSSEDKSIWYPGRILGNCDPLPEEWMQILITEQMKKSSDKSLNQTIKL